MKVPIVVIAVVEVEEAYVGDNPFQEDNTLNLEEPVVDKMGMAGDTLVEEDDDTCEEVGKEEVEEEGLVGIVGC